MDRIENMVSYTRFMPENEFADAERFLKEKMQENVHQARATLGLASLYVKKGREYMEFEKAIRMREICIDMNRTDWNQIEGEWVDVHRREIERLQKKMKK